MVQCLELSKKSFQKGLVYLRKGKDARLQENINLVSENFRCRVESGLVALFGICLNIIEHVSIHCCSRHPGDNFQMGPNLDLSKALNNGYCPLLLRTRGTARYACFFWRGSKT